MFTLRDCTVKVTLRGAPVGSKKIHSYNYYLVVSAGGSCIIINCHVLATCTECCELQVATCRCDLKCSTEHSSDCGSVATEFLKVSELYRHNCACGIDW